MQYWCNLAAKERGLECTCVNNDDFIVLGSGGSRHHWVSVCTVWLSHSKWLSEYSNESTSNFALSWNTPPRQLFGWFRRPQLWSIGDWQLHQDNMPAHASRLVQFFGKASNHPGDSAPLQPRFGALKILTSPKPKITFERKKISDHQWDSGKYNGAADGDRKKCVRTQVPTLKGTEASLSHVQCFLHFVSSSINV